MGIRFAILDLDDTLFATERAKRRARRALRGLGIDPRRFALADVRWWNRFEAGQCDLEDALHGRFVDCGLPMERIQETNEAYRAMANVIKLRAGAVRLVRRFEAAGIRSVILTNAPWHAGRERSLQPLLAHVDGVIWGGDLAVRKPHPVIFLQALSRLGGRPAEAASIGDRFHIDIQPALDLGFARTFWLTRQAGHDDPRVTCVPNLLQLASLI